jgi:glycine cleavage system H protein
MNTPSDLQYAPSHEWIRLNADGTATVGITDHAQTALGDVVFIELPQPGRRFEAGAPCAVIESVKAASDIYAPLSGEITQINEALTAAPEQVNHDAYAAWLFTIKPENPPPWPHLMDASSYEAQCADS